MNYDAGGYATADANPADRPGIREPSANALPAGDDRSRWSTTLRSTQLIIGGHYRDSSASSTRNRLFPGHQ